VAKKGGLLMEITY